MHCKQTRGLEEEESGEDHDYENTEGHDSVGTAMLLLRATMRKRWTKAVTLYVNVQQPFVDDAPDKENSSAYEDF